MNKNIRPELILSFAGITGAARAALSAKIQTALFAMGYFWSANVWMTEQKADCLDAENLHICSPEWCPAHITYCNGVPASSGACYVFNAATQVERFLDMASRALVEKVKIMGVDVTITPHEITADTTDLLTKVMAEAKAVKAKEFGR